MDFFSGFNAQQKSLDRLEMYLRAQWEERTVEMILVSDYVQQTSHDTFCSKIDSNENRN